MDTLDDVLSVDFIQEIMNYVDDNPVLRRFADASCTYLIGHSRVRACACLSHADLHNRGWSFMRLPQRLDSITRAPSLASGRRNEAHRFLLV
jgi:hypothetical protein